VEHWTEGISESSTNNLKIYLNIRFQPPISAADFGGRRDFELDNRPLKSGRHDPQHNNTQHNDIQHNDTQRKRLMCDSQRTMLCYYAECHHADCHILFSIMLNVVMLSVEICQVLTVIKQVASNKSSLLLEHAKVRHTNIDGLNRKYLQK
jgi:hypothetical protein